jgi:hypothetical protein
MGWKKSAVLGLIASMTLAACGTGMPALRPSAFGTDLQAEGMKGPRPANAAEWTVLVYGAGDNNLSDFIASDINEMEAGLTTDKVKVVMLADQMEQGDSRILEIKHDPAGVNDRIVSTVVNDRGAVIPASKEVNTGDPRTLEKFVEWGVKAYPAKRYMFVPWNHGGGNFAAKGHLKSLCWDDTSGSNLNLVDFWRAAQRINTKAKFDVIGFDMCLLGHIETAWQLRDLGSFLVSSEKIEPGDGWDYQSVMRTFSRNPQIYPRELSAEIAKGYHAWYKARGEQTTISAMDLQKVKDKLVPAVNALSDDLRSKLAQPSVRNALKTVAQKTAEQTAVGDGEETAIDLGLLAALLTSAPGLDPQTRALANKVDQELQRSTVINLTNGLPRGQYNGLKIYMDMNGLNADYLNGAAQSFGTSGWAKLLKAFFG